MPGRCLVIKIGIKESIADMHKLSLISIVLLFWVMFSYGCATLRTVPHFTLDSPKLYSGTRMDVDAIKQNQALVLRKYHVEAPSYPALDLPFSFLLDTVILIPVTIPVAISVAVLE
jgi:uncharacterized protein YceK